MNARKFLAAALAACALAPPVAAAADMLFVSTSPAAYPDRPQKPGGLYQVDLPSGTVTSIGAINLEGFPIMVAGFAIHPRSGVLYGLTSETSPNRPKALVTVDTKTAAATGLGDLGIVASDIAFDADGNAFVWLRETGQLGRLDVATAKIAPMGKAGAPGEPGGIGIDPQGRIFVVSSGGAGSIDRIDPATGAITQGAFLSGAPFPAGINSITFSPDGDLYAVNSNRGAPARSALIQVNIATGIARRIGALPDDADAVVFLRTPWSFSELFATRNGITLLIAIVLVTAALAYVFVWDRPRNR